MDGAATRKRPTKVAAGELDPGMINHLLNPWGLSGLNARLELDA
jgi:hypothetical protein